MARSKEFDMNLVLHKAMEVFGHYGYEGTSLPILLEGLGIARQSLYDTYGTKKDLFIKAVKHYVNEKSSAVVVHLEKSESVKEAIHAIFREIVFVLQVRTGARSALFCTAPSIKSLMNRRLPPCSRRTETDWSVLSMKLWFEPSRPKS